MEDDTTLTLEFRAMSDDGSGGPLPEVFREYRDAYLSWMSKSRTDDPALCTEALRTHMPELMPAFESLLERFGGNDETARFLTLYNPPRIVRACSQLVVDTPDGPALIRTYDHHPDLFDGLILDSAWSGRRSLSVTDCLWGALDGINDEGLAVALAFGGRKTAGDGFAAPLVVRYLLQTCASTSDARRALERLPLAMPYTFVVLDASGDFVTAFLGPGRTPRFVRRRASTNHQGRVEWPAYAKHVESVARLSHLEQILGEQDAAQVAESRFVEPPLWRRDYRGASGTLYASRFVPRTREMSLLWPGERRRYAVGETIDETFEIELTGAAPLT